MVEVITFDRGDTIRMNNSFTNIDDVAYDPNTIEIRIYDPKGSLIKTVTYAAGDIKKEELGVFYYDYDIASDALLGSYITKWIGTAAGFSDVVKDQFKVVKSDEILYCTVEEVWNRAGIDSEVLTRDEVIPMIRDSMAEIDAMMGRTFSYGNEKTEWFDTNKNDINVKVDTLYLNHKPINSITSIKEYNLNKEVVDEIESDDYWINMKTGRITLLDTHFTKQIHRVEVVYTCGYDSIPDKISGLCGVMSAIRILTHQIGMQYDDVTSWSSCGLSVGVGEPYTSMARAIEFLTKERTALITSIGRLKPSSFVL